MRNADPAWALLLSGTIYVVQHSCCLVTGMASGDVHAWISTPEYSKFTGWPLALCARRPCMHVTTKCSWHAPRALHVSRLLPRSCANYRVATPSVFELCCLMHCRQRLHLHLRVQPTSYSCIDLLLMCMCTACGMHMHMHNNIQDTCIHAHVYTYMYSCNIISKRAELLVLHATLLPGGGAWAYLRLPGGFKPNPRLNNIP